jgi:putative serine protease PepD
MGPVSDEHPQPRPDQEPTEDTAPLGQLSWQSPTPAHGEPTPAHGEPAPPHGEPTPQGGAYGAPTQHDGPTPYGTPTHDPYGRPTTAYPTYGAPAGGSGAGGRVPGWTWPVIALTALVVGLLGGVLGGVAVSSSMGNNGTTTVIGTDNGAAAPLPADNGSVAAVAHRLLPSTVQILANGGAGGGKGGATGSGFVLDDKGHVITNNHVVADATGPGELEVVDQSGHSHGARIVGRSPVYDIAVLDVEGAEHLRPASIGSSRTMRVGETVVAIGSPLGLSSTVTSGIVSALDRPVTTSAEGGDASYINAVQTDAAINPGNSGGPLVNLRGQVVGVNSAIATTGGGLGGESGSIGVGFAIPMEQVRITAGQILSTGEARYPVIGANVDTGTDNHGAQVVGVPAGTPAAAAGLRKGDLVVAVNGKPVTDGIGLIVAIRSHQPGETITLTVNRDGRQRRVRITLDSKVG